MILTPDNVKSPWIHFESGALAKVVGDSRLAPVLFGLKPSDVGTPLSQFQVTLFSKDDVLKLLRSINSCSGDDALPDQRLEKMHNALWDDVYGDISPLIESGIKKTSDKDGKKDSDNSQILEEILTLSRSQLSILASHDRVPLSKDVVRNILSVAQDAGEPRKIRGMVRALRVRWMDFKISAISLIDGVDISSEIDKKDTIMKMASRVDIVVNDLVDYSESTRLRAKWDDDENLRLRNLSISHNRLDSES